MTSPEEAAFTAISAIAAGIATYLGAEKQARAIRKRMEEGTDAYFEEQRSYRAYPHLSSPRRLRAIGVSLVAGGVALLLLVWYKHS